MSISKLVFEEETYKVLGACIKVHKNLGNGFSEAVYHEALVKELSKAEIPFEQEKKLPIYYDGERLDKYFMTDFVCYGKIILAIKAVAILDATMQQQVVNYLKSTNLEVGLLINFGDKILKWKRLINTSQIPI